MNTLYERILVLCKEKKVTASRMCLDLGLSKSTMSGMKNGRTKGVSVPTAKKIADYFGITVDELYGIKKEQPAEDDGLSADMKELIECIKALPADKVAMLLQVVKSIR